MDGEQEGGLTQTAPVATPNAAAAASSPAEAPADSTSAPANVESEAKQDDTPDWLKAIEAETTSARRGSDGQTPTAEAPAAVPVFVEAPPVPPTPPLEIRAIQTEEVAQNLEGYLDQFDGEELLDRGLMAFSDYGAEELQEHLNEMQRRKAEVILSALGYNPREVADFVVAGAEDKYKGVKLLALIARNIQATEGKEREMFVRLRDRVEDSLVKTIAVQSGITKEADEPVLRAQKGSVALESMLIHKGVSPEQAKALVEELISVCVEVGIVVTSDTSLEALLEAILSGKSPEVAAQAAAEQTSPGPVPVLAAEATSQVESPLPDAQGESANIVIAKKEKSKYRKALELLASKSTDVLSKISEGMTLEDFIAFLLANQEGGRTLSSYKEHFDKGEKIVGEDSIDFVFQTPESIFDAMEETLTDRSLSVEGEITTFIQDKEKKFVKPGTTEFDKGAYYKWLLSKYKLVLLLNQEAIMKRFREQLFRAEKGRHLLENIPTKDGEKRVEEYEREKIEISQEALDRFLKRAKKYAEEV